MLGQTTALGAFGHNAVNAYAPNPVPAPRTIASAISRMEGLNERLSKACAHVSSLADMLGALRQAGKDSAPKPPSAGAIGRLNDSADAAHSQLADIEELLSAIASALG